MKKSAIFLPLLAALLLSSCQGSDTYKDGTYRTQFKEPDDHGWTEYVEVTVSGGKFTAVEFDAMNEDGEKKTQDEEYKEAYTGAGYQTYPADYTQKLEDSLLQKQDANNVEMVAGATKSSNSFKELVKALESRMKKGDTSTLLVEAKE